MWLTPLFINNPADGLDLESPSWEASEGQENICVEMAELKRDGLAAAAVSSGLAASAVSSGLASAAVSRNDEA